MSDNNDEEVFYTTESKVLAIAPKIPALLSIMGSSYIIYNVLFVQRKRTDAGRNQLYLNLMLALSVSDILASHIYFLGTFLIPRGSGGPFGLVFWAFGTDGTCSYSGFFNQFAVASPIYNTMLSIYFLLKIRYGWKEIELQKIGPLLHGFPLAFATGTSFFALLRQPDTLYGNVFWTCWINPDPPQPDFRWFQWSFLFAPVWICVFFQTIAMAVLYLTIRGVEKESKVVAKKINASTKDKPAQSTDEDFSSSNEDDNSFSAEDEVSGEDPSETMEGGNVAATAAAAFVASKKQRHSRMIAIQGILYAGAFYITWLFPTVQRFMEVFGASPIFALQALDTTLLPLQGLFNVLIYLRPKYVFYKRKYPEMPIRLVLQLVHDRANEESVVEKYTTMQKSRSSRNNSRNTNVSNNNRSKVHDRPNEELFVKKFITMQKIRINIRNTNASNNNRSKVHDRANEELFVQKYITLQKERNNIRNNNASNNNRSNRTTKSNDSNFGMPTIQEASERGFTRMGSSNNKDNNNATTSQNNNSQKEVKFMEENPHIESIPEMENPDIEPTLEMKNPDEEEFNIDPLAAFGNVTAVSMDGSLCRFGTP